MAWTQQQLDDLDAAIATGALKVKYADRTVEYRSLREMRQLREQIARSLSTAKSHQIRQLQFTRGSKAE